MYGQLRVQMSARWSDTLPMVPGIGDIVLVLGFGAVALLGAGHALAAWASFEIQVHTMRVEAKKLRETLERRRAAMLEDADVQDLGAVDVIEGQPVA